MKLNIKKVASSMNESVLCQQTTHSGTSSLPQKIDNFLYIHLLKKYQKLHSQTGIKQHFCTNKVIPMSY